MATQTTQKKIRQQYVAVIKAPPPIQFIAIHSDGKVITEVKLGARVHSDAQLPPVLEKAVVQFKEYFAGKRQNFDLPLQLNGTPFQTRVWKALQKLKFGESATYQTLAQRVGNPNSARAVGNALGKNPIPLIVPCHRIVSSNGIGGFTGGLPIKRYLLSKEGVDLN